jgi:hypothetical protein
LILAVLAISYLLLQNSVVQTFIISKITQKLSKNSSASIVIGKVDIIYFDQLVLNDVLITGAQNDTILFTKSVLAEIDTLNFRKRKIHISELLFDRNTITISRNDSNQLNFTPVLNLFSNENNDTLHYWTINCNHFNFKNSDLTFKDLKTDNERFFYFNQLNFNISDFYNYADSTAFRLTDLSLNYNSRLNINEFSAKVSITESKVQVDSLNVKTDKSQINNTKLLMRVGTNQEILNKYMLFDAQFQKSTFNISEFGELIPSLKEINETVEMSGRIYGNLKDIKGKDLLLRSGTRTSANFDFYINGIEDLETMYLFLDLKKIETTMRDISNFELISNGQNLQLQFPEQLYNAGLLSYTGNFSGFISDFVSFGTLRSKMGIIKTDVSVIPKKDGLYTYRGKVTTKDFELGNLLDLENLGKITFNGNVDGDYNFSDKTISGLFSGEIARLEARNYVYENIELDGYYKDKMFDGMINVNDSNLQFTFLGRWDESSDIPNYDFSLNVEKFVPAKLNISKNTYQGELAFKMKAKFTGDKIDNLKGVIIVDDGFYKNKYGNINLGGIQLISFPHKSSMELTINSNYLDIEVNGNYQFQDIWNSLKSNMNRYIPALSFDTPKDFKPNVFDYKVIFKNLDDLTAVLAPELKVETPFFLYGKIDSDKSDIQLEGSIPGFQYKNLWFRNIFISNKAVETRYVSKIKFGEILHKKGASIYNLAVNSEIGKNVFHNKIDWFARDDSTGYSSIKSYTFFSESENTWYPKMKTDFLPSGIFLTDTTWNLKAFNTLVDSTSVNINNFVLSNENQRISLNGNISNDSTELLFIHLKNIDLEYFQQRFSGKNELKGIANSSFIISNLYKQPLIVADAKINDFDYKNQPVGDVIFTSNWDIQTSEIKSELEIINKNNHRTLLVKGSLNPKTKALNYYLKADSMPLKLLETVILNGLSDFSGTTSGIIKVGGTANKILMDGIARVDNGGLLVDYIQTKYFIDDVVYFKSDTIEFRDIIFTDNQKNKGTLNGILVHDNFKNMLYDLSMESEKIRVLNTTLRYNEQFYGDAFANCKVNIFGKGLKLGLDGSMTTLPGTEVNISMEYENAMEQYEFLEFANTIETPEEEMFFYNPPKTDFTMSLNVEVTPDAKTQLIYNSQIGDVIKAEGEGILLFNMDKYGDISLSGDYTVFKGDYLFTLQSIVNKRFTIAPGGIIVWSGDPYNADINLSAIYSLKASLSDLDSYSNASYLYQRIPVECIINLSNELINPTIDFEINFPDENEGIKTQLQQYFNTEEEINKQILSLIVMGKFYTPEYMRGQYQSQNPNMIGTTASELFSNQLSNWLSQISKNVDVGFKYRPGNSITNDELELALSTQIFNDRVLLNGNIGNNVNPESKNSSQIVGDFDMRVKLTRNGKIQLKAYNHSNNDLIYETAPYTQGVGFSFKEEYNSFQELMQKIASIFTKKKK